MANFKKGLLTKQKIINESKRLFYENGYTKTSLQDIVTASDITLGTLTYYFKKKDDIVKNIYNELFISIDDYINSIAKDNHVFTKFCYLNIIIYDIILNDNNNSRFYFEVLKNKSNYRIIKWNIEKFCRDCLQSFNIEFTQTDLDILLYCDFGARREIFINYFNNLINISSKQIAYYTTRSLARLMSVDNMVIEQNINKAFKFVASNDISHIKFLI